MRVFFSCLRERMPCLWRELIPLEVSAGAGRDGQHHLPVFPHCTAAPGHQLQGCPTPWAASTGCQAAAAPSCPPPCLSCPPNRQGACAPLCPGQPLLATAWETQLHRPLHNSQIHFQLPVSHTAPLLKRPLPHIFFHNWAYQWKGMSCLS